LPNTPGTPRRTIRVSDDLWEAAQATADEFGENLSDEIRKFLERYTRKKARS
jgi:antitoxin component of RelBE/YafQ-DinJ toxin-antitoxin module